MTYKSDDIMETENENVDRSKIAGYELEEEIPVSPKLTKKSKAPIPMEFKVDNHNQSESSVPSVMTKSRTSSPSSNKSLDDIVLMSEVIDTLTEMKEPNGKTYFVDEIRAVDTPEETEQKTAIGYLDDVLKKEEVNDDIVLTIVDEIGIPTSVVAVIHLSKAVEDPQYVDYEENTSSEDTTEKSVSTADNVLHKNESVLVSLTESELTRKSPDEPASDNIQTSETIDSELNEQQLGDFKVHFSMEEQNDIKPENILTQDASLESIELPNISLQSNVENSPNLQENPSALVTATAEVQGVPLNFVESETFSNQSDTENTLTDEPEKKDQELQEVTKRSTEEDNNAETSMTFKERLAMLLGQQPVAEARRVSPRLDSHQPHNTTNTKLKHSKSEPDIFNSMAMQGVFNDIRSKYEHNDPDPGSKKPLQLTATGDIPIDNSDASVPVPPKFDPFIYKTIGTRHNTRMALKIGDDNENEIVPKPPMTAPIIMDNDHNNDIVLRKKSMEEDDQTRMVSIKDRLENIFKRGPPDRYSRPKSIVPQVPSTGDTVSVVANVTNIDNDDKIDEENQRVIRFKEAKRPFDTVHKQKVLFDDVLKSIGVETRPSVIRANSITKSRQKPTTIEDARNALKHVSADWKKNVN